MTRRLILLGLAGALWACSSTPSPSPPAPDGSLRAVEVGALDLSPAEALRVVITDSLAFVGCGSDGIRIVDITEPSAPEVVAVLEDLRADALCLDDDLLYVLSHSSSWYFSDTSRLTSVDVIDPRNPGARRTVRRALGRPADLSVEASNLALAAGDEGLFLGRGLSASLTDLTALLGADSALAVLTRRNRVYAVGRSVAFDFWLGYGRVRNTICVLDGPTGRLLARTELPGAEHDRVDLAFSDNRLLMSHGDSLRVITIEPSGEPSRIITLPLAGARAVAADGGVAVVAGDRLALINLSDPEYPRLAELSALTSDAGGAGGTLEIRDVAIRNQRIAVAAGASGLRLYQVESK